MGDGVRNLYCLQIINRRTIENIRIAGLQIEQVEDLDSMGMFKFILARAQA